MIQFPTQSHYPVTELTSPCRSLIMLSGWVGCNKSKFVRHWFDLTIVSTYGFESPPIHPKRDTNALLIRPSGLVRYDNDITFTRITIKYHFDKLCVVMLAPVFTYSLLEAGIKSCDYQGQSGLTPPQCSVEVFVVLRPSYI